MHIWMKQSDNSKHISCHSFKESDDKMMNFICVLSVQRWNQDKARLTYSIKRQWKVEAEQLANSSLALLKD